MLTASRRRPRLRRPTASASARPPAPTLVELDREVVVDRHAGTVDGVAVPPALRRRPRARGRGRRRAGPRRRQRAARPPADPRGRLRGQRFVFTPPDRLAGAAAVGDGTLVAPMPGTVLDVRVAAGDAVEEGQVLGTMEAMKMELALKAPFAGTVTTVGAVGRGAGPDRHRAVRGRGGRHDASALPMVVPEPGLPERVTIYEVGARDGLQNEKALVPVEVKEEFVRRLLAAGLPVVEATSFVHPRWVPQLADAAELMTRLGADGLRPAGAGAQRARPRPRPRARPAPRRDLRLGHRDLRPEEPQPLLRRAVRDVRAHRRAAPARPGSTCAPTSRCASATRGRARCRVDQVVAAGRRLLDLGASQLSLGDTIGVGTAGHVTALVARLRRRRRGPPTGWPCTSTTPTARRCPTSRPACAPA